MNFEELLNNRRDQILTIANKHGAYDVRVFGSVHAANQLPIVI